MDLACFRGRRERGAADVPEAVELCSIHTQTGLEAEGDKVIPFRSVCGKGGV